MPPSRQSTPTLTSNLRFHSGDKGVRGDFGFCSDNGLNFSEWETICVTANPGFCADIENHFSAAETFCFDIGLNSRQWILSMEWAIWNFLMTCS